MSETPVIGPFRGQYRFLSNFWVEPSGKSNEHYFQAAKVTDKEARKLIFDADGPREAKRLGSRKGMEELSQRLGREIKLRDDWDDICLDVMRWGLERKFQDPSLRARLLATGDVELVELNHWHDVAWGRCTCARHQGEGENHLGRLLMELRAKLRAESAEGPLA